MQKETKNSKLINDYIINGRIVPVEITCSLIKQRIDLNKEIYSYFLVDGFPRNFNNLNGWMREMSSTTKIVGTLNIRCDEEVIISRIKSRGRMDDKLDTLTKRMTSFYKETLPMLEKLRETSTVIDINGNKDMFSTHREIINKLKYLM